jgi:hypothetical protein
MSEVVTGIRPRAQYLKQLATQARREPDESEAPSDGGLTVVLELKLQTPTARYWLCTQGLTQPQPGLPKAWVMDYITPEYLRDDGSWRFEEAEAYGPQNTPWLQGHDYLQMLTDEYERLKSRFGKDENWQITEAMEVTEAEMRQVVAQLDAIVRQKQAQNPSVLQEDAR